MAKVSVIVPVYNAEKYLRYALDSVLKQDFNDVELICVDDGSTDGSLGILKIYNEIDNRIKIVTQKNSGGSAARNTGIKNATGEYVMFLDADDSFASRIVSSAVKVAEKNKTDIVFFNFARFVGKPSTLAIVSKTTPGKKIEKFTKQSYAERFFNDFAVLTWNKLIKRAVLVENEIYFDTKLSHDHDVDFSVRLMLAANNFSYLDRVGYYYRIDSSGSLTSSKHIDPSNVLEIISNLRKQVITKYKHLSRSFDNYAADMVIGAIDRQMMYPNSQREVFDFAYKVFIPQNKLNDKTDDYFYNPEVREVLEVISSGDYDEYNRRSKTLKKKLKSLVKKTHTTIQLAMAYLLI